MPPRHAYWTILIDDKPTAFRAREREELQPTFVQLQRKNANVIMRWFARGKLWPSREAERDDFQMQRQAASAPRERTAVPVGERRGSDWRPGGAHKDPRDRFKKKNRPERAWSEKDPATQRERDKPGYQAARPRAPREDRPWKNEPRGDQERSKTPNEGRWRDKPSGEAKRPWSGKPRDNSGAAPGFRPQKPGDRKPWEKARPPHNDRPWQTKPTGPRAQRAPWVGKPPSPPRGDRPFGGKRPWDGKPRSDKPGGFRADEPSRGGRKPWNAKPGGAPSGDRPWSAKPTADRKPWQKKIFRPSGPPRPDARKRRDDEPPDRD